MRDAMSTMGRPSSYSTDLCELAHNYCLLGATNDELAEFFGVSPRTIDNWIAGHPEFETVVKDGRVVADARVARGLYARAIGYDRRRGRVRTSACPASQAYANLFSMTPTPSISMRTTSPAPR
jgi:hypothetical protein